MKMTRKSLKLAAKTKVNCQVSKNNQISLKRRKVVALNASTGTDKVMTLPSMDEVDSLSCPETLSGMPVSSQSCKTNSDCTVHFSTASATCQRNHSETIKRGSAQHFSMPEAGADNDAEEMSQSHVHMTPCPLPTIPWAERYEVWRSTLKKENDYSHSETMFESHPEIEPHMRTILFNWMMEVCKAFRLHRETCYLAFEYFDRLMHHSSNFHREHLQLAGLTVLFVAAKFEEIYPPKAVDFADMMNGISMESLFQMEKAILKTLGWRLSALTPVSWVQFYLQLDHHQRNIYANVKPMDLSRPPDRNNSERHLQAVCLSPPLLLKHSTPHKHFPNAFRRPDKWKSALYSGLSTRFTSVVPYSLPDGNHTRCRDKLVLRCRRQAESAITEVDSFPDSVDHVYVGSNPDNVCLYCPEKCRPTGRMHSVPDPDDSGMGEEVNSSGDHASLTGYKDRHKCRNLSQSYRLKCRLDERACSPLCGVVCSIGSTPQSDLATSSSDWTRFTRISSDESSVLDKSADSYGSCEKSTSSTVRGNPCVSSDDVKLNQSNNSRLSELVACTEVIDLVADTMHSDDADLSSPRLKAHHASELNLASIPGSALFASDSDDDGEGVCSCHCDSMVQLQCLDAEEFLFPEFCQIDFLRSILILDLAIMDMNCLRYSYRTLSAAAVYLATGNKNVDQLSCVEWSELQPCVDWMGVYKEVMDQVTAPGIVIEQHNDILECDAFDIQTHSFDISVTERAVSLASDFLRNTKPGFSHQTTIRISPTDRSERHSMAYGR